MQYFLFDFRLNNYSKLSKNVARLLSFLDYGRMSIFALNFFIILI